MPFGRGISIVVMRRLPKPVRRVRFPYPALENLRNLFRHNCRCLVLILEKTQMRSLATQGVLGLPFTFLRTPNNTTQPASIAFSRSASIEHVHGLISNLEVGATVVKAVVVFMIDNRRPTGQSKYELVKIDHLGANADSGVVGVIPENHVNPAGMVLQPWKIVSVDQYLVTIAIFGTAKKRRGFSTDFMIVELQSLLPGSLFPSRQFAQRDRLSDGPSGNTNLFKAIKNASGGSGKLVSNGIAGPACFVEGSNLIRRKFSEDHKESSIINLIWPAGSPRTGRPFPVVPQTGFQKKRGVEFYRHVRRLPSCSCITRATRGCRQQAGFQKCQELQTTTPGSPCRRRVGLGWWGCPRQAGAGHNERKSRIAP